MDDCDLLEAEVGRFAALIDDRPLEAPVPSCPGWSVEDLTTHLGTVHRWAEHLVRTLAPERIPTEAMGLGPAEPSGAWIRAGGSALVATLRAADPAAPMWAWGKDQHVRFWSRRQLHETLVHRMDAELALGLAPTASPALAADAIDEFLVNLAAAVYFSPRVKNLRGDGTRLAFRANDEGRAWTIVLHTQGYSVEDSAVEDSAVEDSAVEDSAVEDGAPAPAAALEGPALPLLLVLYRRLPLSTPGIEQVGDPAVVDLWMANSALE
jgi:uncharacterized protein (TIGR03083 family)